MLPLGQLAQEPSQVVLLIDRVARMPMSQVVAGAVVLTVLRVLAWAWLKRTKPHERHGCAFSGVRLVNDAADALVYAGVVVFLLVRPFGIQTFYIPSGSMIDTLLINDYIVANKLVYRISEPKSGDIVVFKPPKRALNPGQGETDFIKRLVAVPGDLVEWKDKVLYRNGQKVDEPYVDYTDITGKVVPRAQWPAVAQANFKLVELDGKVIPVQYWGESANQPGTITHCAEEYAAFDQAQMRRMLEAEPVRVPPGMYVFFGDNRNGSFDSRGWGLVPREDIIGRSEFIFLPFSRWSQTR